MSAKTYSSSLLFKLFYTVLFFVAFFLGGCTSSQKLVNSDWYEVETEHFRIVTNDDATKAKELAIDLEMLRPVAREYLKFVPDQQKLTIYALDDSLSFRGLFSGDDSRRVIGAFQNTFYGSFAIVNLEGNRFYPDNPARQTLFHEYIHFLSYGRDSFNLPYWYSEGVAEIFSTVSFSDGEFRLGRMPASRVVGLNASNLLPLDKLLDAKKGSLSLKDRTELYASGWMLTHWLFFDVERRKALNKYLVEYDRDPDSARSLWEELGMTFEELESQYLHLAKLGSFGYVDRPLDLENGIKVNPLVKSLQKDKAILEIARFMSFSGQDVIKLKDFIEYAKKEGNSSYELIVTMALAELHAGNILQAKEWLSSIPVDHHEQEWFLEAKARVGLVEELSKAENINLTVVADIRDEYIKLINSHDDVPVYWYELAVAMQVLGYPRESYFEMLEQAYLRAPRHTGIAWWYAHELYISRDREYFSQVVGPLMVQLSSLEREGRLDSMRREIENVSSPRLSAKPVKEGLGENLIKYQDMPGEKALALALDFRGAFVIGFSEENINQEAANDAALNLCEKSRQRYKVFGKCRLYAEGNRIVDSGVAERKL
ncbi:hypothetical protein ACJJJB_12745 [Microbulbifer sp. ANSA001]|uniref:hypothetical protein n=1 Tax=Microbulbifer sp. ANSA001 TaxID=3243358 RepID=UPI00404337A6